MSMLSSRPASQQHEQDLQPIKTYLLQTLSREFGSNHVPPEDLPTTVKERLEDLFSRSKTQLPPTIRAKLHKEVLDELLGFGPIQPLLDDPEITEVMVNRADLVYIEKSGRILKTGVRFESDEHVRQVIDRIILPLGRRIDADHPTVDARLPDGSRVNAVIPPVALDGANITIRKFSKDKLSVQQLIEFGSLTEQTAEFLRACVIGKLNIIISGGTGSGKTTLLNILSSYIPEDERIVTIEDAAELALQQEHVLRLETKAARVDGEGAVTIRDLVRNSLRMRPDRIVVGECRGGEALDMLQAMNTGHDGSLTTLHANSPRDALSRLETMTMMSGLDLPLKVIRQQIASAVDLIVQQSRLKDGSRKVTSITEVAGMEGETVVMTDIFKFDQTGVSQDGQVLGEMKATGIRPMFGPRLEAAGFKLGAEVFMTSVADKFTDNHRSRRR